MEFSTILYTNTIEKVALPGRPACCCRVIWPDPDAVPQEPFCSSWQFCQNQNDAIPDFFQLCHIFAAAGPRGEAITVRLPEIATIKDVRLALRQRSGPQEFQALLNAGAPLQLGLKTVVWYIKKSHVQTFCWSCMMFRKQVQWLDFAGFFSLESCPILRWMMIHVHVSRKKNAAMDHGCWGMSTLIHWVSHWRRLSHFEDVGNWC